MTFTEEELSKALFEFLDRYERTKTGHITAQGRVFIGVFHQMINRAKEAKK
jgi:hypothetical protein